MLSQVKDARWVKLVLDEFDRDVCEGECKDCPLNEDSGIGDYLGDPISICNLVGDIRLSLSNMFEEVGYR